MTSPREHIRSGLFVICHYLRLRFVISRKLPTLPGPCRIIPNPPRCGGRSRRCSLVILGRDHALERHTPRSPPEPRFCIESVDGTPLFRVAESFRLCAQAVFYVESSIGFDSGRNAG